VLPHNYSEGAAARDLEAKDSVGRTRGVRQSNCDLAQRDVLVIILGVEQSGM